MKFEIKLVISLSLAFLCLIGYIIGYHQAEKECKVTVEITDSTNQEDYDLLKIKVSILEGMIYDFSQEDWKYLNYANALQYQEELWQNKIRD